MLNNINIDRINYTNISSVEQKRLYKYMYLLADIHPFKLEYLLNTSNIDTHSVIERFIYNIACTQLSTKLNKQFTHGVNYITFSFLKKEANCCETSKFRCVENSIMTSIINLTDSISSPFLFVKLTADDYERNNTQHIRECELSILKQGNIMSFDPNKYIFDDVNMFTTNVNSDFEFNIIDNPNYSLVIEILNKNPINTPVFNYDINSSIVSQIFKTSKYELYANNCENIDRICYTISSPTEERSVDILLQEEILLKALYNLFELKDKKALNGLSRMLEPYVEKHLLFKLKVDEKNIVTENKNIVTEKNDKFIQRFTHSSILTPIMCDWIIYEAEQYAFKNGWETTRHENYPTTDIKIENIQSVFTFMILFIKTIDNLICKSYNIEIENIDIKDMFIAKYDANYQNSLDMHVDGNESNISISILLNDDFEGGHLIYADDIISYAEKGDVMIHTKHHTHGVTPVTKGIRYSLVMFLRINCID